MFASNYPVERLYAPYEAIMRGFMEMTRSFSLGQRRMLFHDNARHYYRIER
jgi:predicted TIM-barrel fold metal-dependent hydrolase